MVTTTAEGWPFAVAAAFHASRASGYETLWIEEAGGPANGITDQNRLPRHQFQMTKLPGSSKRTLFGEIADLAKALGRTFVLFYVPLIVLLTFLHFPYDTDPPFLEVESASAPAQEESAGFYEIAYTPDTDEERGIDYEATARMAAEHFKIEDQVQSFVADYSLAGKKVLEVGSGRGYLQDMVDDYTGLDLSPSVARFYHKPFVVGSATEMPFADNTYDGVWTVWVLEHIPQPEKALSEIRRVLKPDGVLFLYVAWNCTPWAADGFDVRPYSDFNWRGKLVKSTVGIRSSPFFQISYMYPTRAIRWAQYGLAGEDTRLRFRALEPNYDVYWEPDSDAAISLDSFETYLWFRARGDECLNCGTPGEEIRRLTNPLILRIDKP